MDNDQDFTLPRLREDISLIEGPTSPDGSPTWSLHDKVRNQYFRIGWVEFECLSRWHLRSAKQLMEAVNNETTLNIRLAQIQMLIHFLASSNLVITDSEQLKAIRDKSHKQRYQRAAKSYLFFKIRLLHPDAFLARTLPWVKPFFSRGFALFIIVIGIISLYLVSRQWHTFTHTFSYFFNVTGVMYYMVALFFVKVFHEFGHAYTAKYYGCRVPSMGVAILVFWPVFYTDTTDAWRLTSRKKRVHIAAAGIVVELMIAVLATFAWIFLAEGPTRSAVFFIATSSWMFSLFINSNPFLRFDGYYILSDWLNIGNLQTRAFALARAHFRRSLLGLDDPAPYTFKPKMARGLIIYAYATWVYRLFLMVGISLIIYHLFFKLLGIVMMFASIISFLFAPIYKELIYLWSQRKRIHWNKRSIITLCISFLILSIIVLPWQSSIVAPALLEYQRHTEIYSPASAQITTINVKNGSLVSKGRVLMQLNSPELDYKIDQAKHDIKILQTRLRAEFGQTKTHGFRQTDQAELARKTAELQANIAQKNKLKVIAPFAGKISGLDEGYKVGRWVGENRLLLELVDPRKTTITAYVPERDYQKIRDDKLGRFYPDVFRASPTIKARITNIDQVATPKLDEPYLASTHGGDIAVHEQARDAYQIKDAFYRVVLVPEKTTPKLVFATPGVLQLTGHAESLLKRFWVAATSVIIRESGF